MCKTRFTKVIHNIQANDVYDTVSIPVAKMSMGIKLCRKWDFSTPLQNIIHGNIKDI